MFRQWWHIVVVCLLATLGIRGTNGIRLRFEVYRLLHHVDEVKTTKSKAVDLKDCNYGRRKLLRHYDTVPYIDFDGTPLKRRFKKKLFEVRTHNDKVICSVYYNPQNTLISRNIDGFMSIKRHADKLVHFELLLPVENVREVGNDHKTSGIPLHLFHYNLDNTWTFVVPAPSAEDAVNSPAIETFGLSYRVGTFPYYTRNPSLFSQTLNLLWNFKTDPTSTSTLNKRIEFSCGPNQPVELFCANEMCDSVAVSSTTITTTNILAFIVDNGNDYWIVKGNKVKPQDVFCTLYAEQVGFPRSPVARHINVAYGIRGFRVFTNSLMKFVGSRE